MGDYVAAGTRHGFSYLLVNSSNVLTESVTILASPYMGFVEANGECGNIYRNIRIAPDIFVGLPLGANVCMQFEFGKDTRLRIDFGLGWFEVLRFEHLH